MTFIQSVQDALDEFGERDALVDRHSRMTFAQVGTTLNCTTKALTDLGCKKGCAVAALTLSCAPAVLLEWATYKLGSIWIGIPWRERRPETIVSILKTCRPQLFFLEPTALQSADLDFLLNSSELKLQKLKTQPGNPFGHLDCFRLQPGKKLAKVSFKINNDDIVRIRFTSGVSGRPKGIIYTQQTQEAVLRNIGEFIIKNQQEVMIHGAPIGWASGSLIAAVLKSGGCNVLRPKWITEDFAETVWREQCTLTFLAPRMLSFLIEHSEQYGVTWAKSLRRVILAGAPTPVLTMRRARRLFRRTEFYTTLGMTEASFPITWHAVERADVDQRNRRAYVPLGPLTPFYSKSVIDDSASPERGCGELLVKGANSSNAVAPGSWIWLNKDGSSRKTPKTETWQSKDGARTGLYHSGDIVKRVGQTLHYVCRKDESCLSRKIMVPVDAIEALLRDCKRVREARIERIWRGRRKRVDVTIQTSSEGLDEQRIRSHFRRNALKANLKGIDIGTIGFGRVELTASGKVVHAKGLCAGQFRGGLDDNAPRPWREFVFGKNQNLQGCGFSELASAPLYFYVGAGLSMSSGLAGWGEMAGIVWWYLKHYEKKTTVGLCPPDVGKKNAEFLQKFVTSGKVLSHNSKHRDGLSRTALLNMILRYRAPRTTLNTKDPQKLVRMLVDGRTRYGEEPYAEDLVLQSLIWRTHCHGVFTSNYDMLLEHAFSLFNHGAALRSYRYNADFLRYLMSNRRFVLKLHGDINDIGRMQLSPHEAWKGNRLFVPYRNDLKKAYTAALEKGHMIYMGMGFRDETIIRLHQAWRKNHQSAAHLRVALIPHSELKRIKDDLGRRQELFDDIVFLTYGDESDGAGSHHHVVREFLTQIAQVRGRGSHSGDQRYRCAEASDLHRQIFLSSPDEPLGRRFATSPWTCRVTSIRH